MTQKAAITASLILALVASVSEAQVQYQQQYQQVQPTQAQRGSQSTQRISGYTNVVMSDAEKAKPSTGATFYDTSRGVAVRSTFANGPAQKAGMTSGDVITKVNGKALQNTASLNAMIEGMSAGQQLQLTKLDSRDKESEVSLPLMTTGEIMMASIVPEAGVYDQAVSQADVQLKRMEQQIKNMEADLADLKKGYDAQKQRMQDLQAKAKTARAAAEKQKAAAEAARLKRIEELKKQAEEAANQ